MTALTGPITTHRPTHTSQHHHDRHEHHGATRPAAVRRIRPEIQGLRALAVGLVVAYHLDPHALPGGYVGVDVFFVISGFLISQHLLDEAATTGRVSLAAFWAGRVRRIMPAALITTATIVIAAMLLMPRTQAADVGRTAVWAALSAANWLFAGQSIDYQAQSPDASPFEHFWSLGVEEQFYVVWPLAVLLVAVVLRKRGFSRRAAAVPFGIVFAASLAFGISFTASGSQAAYFITPTRMWELAAGGLLAALLGQRQPPRTLAAVLQVGGLGAIVGGAVLFTSGTPMPGLAAMLPVAGAVGVIAGGDVAGMRTVWAFAPVRFVGDISYSLYLWHWPMIVFARTITGHEAGTLQRALIVVAALGTATLSYRFIERPFRRIRVTRPLRVVAIGAVAVLVVIGVGVAPIARDHLITQSQQSARARVLDPAAGAAIGYPQLDAAADRTWARPDHVLVPNVSTITRDIPLVGCTIEPQSTTSPVCIRGDVHGTTTIALVGDSHAYQWAGAISTMAARHHWRLVTILHNSCPFNLVPRRFELADHSHCTQAVRWALPILKREHVSVVLTSAYREEFQDRLDAGVDGFASMWTSLGTQGMSVVALGDTPEPPANPTIAECAVGANPAACGTTRAKAEATVDPLRLAAAKAHVPFVDPVSALCGATRCPGVIGNVVVYRDDNHVSNTYLTTAVPWLQKSLAPVVQRAIAAKPQRWSAAAT